MAAYLNVKWRYAAYGIVTAGAAAAYLWLGQGAETSLAVSGKPVAAEEIPALRFVDSGADAAENRDLFAFGKPAVDPPETVPAAASLPTPHPDTAQEDRDLLADLRVIGLVRQSGKVTVLIQIGAKLVTASLGERFGEGDALSVEAIRGSNVLIIDNITKTSKTYALSEE